EPDNFIAPERLNRMEKGRLKLALREVKHFQSFLEQHFRVNLIL
ncbi:MAG: hypothetical protein GWM93_19125, partial [Gemmatimonadetes bacterium]|nr:hypothetical protein [Gemmatimonadota bacterium]NIT68765.1 hypothetical protein [Gemmatimonadota bacterium]NIY37342.1 hypothetical protein [Gemmatimonadota bacterium]